MTGRGVKTTCPYCGVGCGVIAQRKADGSVTIEGDPDHPANFGRLCSKGSALAETLSLDGRLLHPQVAGIRTDWNDALDLVAAKFRETIDAHGPDSVAFYVSGQFLTEDYYVANKLMKGYIGSGNIDTNSRLCMASTVAGQKRAFGSDTVPGNYDDLEQADLIIIAGANMAWCHPVLYQRIAAAKEARPDMKVVLVDPRRTMTADIADLHLALDPDTDAALFGGLLDYLANEGALDSSYIFDNTDGITEALEAVSGFGAPDFLSAMTNLPAAQIEAFFALVLNRPKTVTLFSQGINQSDIGTDTVNAILNTHLATGRIGKPGAGPFSLTGQPNAMGGREVGGLANMLAAHMAIENPDHRDLVARYWDAPNIVEGHGLKAIDMFDAVADGRIKAIWIMATNPVVSMPEADKVAQALRDCPFVVVSDVLEKTDTTAYANVLLPSADWGEKNGTVTNSERRISRQRRFAPLPGDVRPDWWQIAEVAKRMGWGQAFSYDSASDIFGEHAALSAFENNGTRDFDIGGLAGVEYDKIKPTQWPCPTGKLPVARLFANGGYFTSDGKANFIAVAPEPRPLKGRAFTLNTGRIRDHWHTMTRTARTPRLSRHIAEPFAEINPEDALNLSLRTADIVKIESDHGHILVRATITNKVNPGQVFVPFHWTNQFAAQARVDALVPAVSDPVSGQPASKSAAVSLSRFEAVQYGFAVTRTRPALPQAEYWAIARIEGGWQIEFVTSRTCVSVQSFADALFGRYDDTISYEAGGIERLVVFGGEGLCGALFVGDAPVAASRGWVTSLMGEKFTDPITRHRIIAGRPGADRPDPGATVCSCFNVGANQITAAVEAGNDSVQAIGQCLNAGTNCGSCRSEIQAIINARQTIAAE